LTGAIHDAASLLFLAVAEAAAIAVVTWQRWNWLRAAAVALVLAEVIGWLVADDPSAARAFVVLALFGALNLAAATAFEVRRGRGSSTCSGLIACANAAVLGLAGVGVAADQFSAAGRWTAAGWWLAGVGLAHALAAVPLLRLQPRNRDLATTLFALGLVFLNLAFVALVSGVAIPVGWAAASAALALPARKISRNAVVVYVVVGAQLALAVGHVLLYDAPLSALAHGGSASIWPVLAIGASAFAIARLTPADEVEWRIAADATVLAAVAYGTAVVVDGPWLAVAWAAEAAAAAALGRRLGDRVAAAGAFGFLLLAALHALAFEARPDALVDGVPDLKRAVVALAVLTGATIATALLGSIERLRWRETLLAVAGALVVYTASIVVVDVAGRGQTGQLLLSGLWAVVGLGALVAGLVRKVDALRVAGFALLGLAIAKLFLYDLSTLESIYRVAAFVVVGVFLLAGAFAYQRVRAAVGEEP
jgi:hypothetical protein